MNWIFFLAAGISLIALSQKRFRESSSWKATVTPLASIIGSGFLIIAPVLKFSMGSYALLGIVILTGFAFFIGDALRFLLQYENERNSIPAVRAISGLSLAFAYIVSVTFYIKILAVFALKAFSIHNDFMGDVFASGVILFIGIFGYFRGLRFLETLEEWSVNTKLSIIIAFLLLLAIFDVKMMLSIESIPKIKGSFGLDGLKVLLGSLVITQGFETSLFLKNVYPKDLLIKSMKRSQIISGVIYILFVGLSIPLFPLITSETETAIIDLSQNVAVVLPFGLILGAQLSQFSAAVADTIGAGGLGENLTQGRITARCFYLIVSLFAVVLIWSIDVFGIIVLSSKAFAIYYIIKVFETIQLSIKLKKKQSIVKYILVLSGLVLCLLIGKSIES